MTYLARCPSGCENFKGDTGTVWVKIDEWAYRPTETPPWGSDKLAKNGANWTVKIPSSLKAGEYLLRHEILGLHVAGQKNGAQFYPSCAQIVVSGSGSTDLPTGVALPGAYDPEDPGVSCLLRRRNGLTLTDGRFWRSFGLSTRARCSTRRLVGPFGRVRKLKVAKGRECTYDVWIRLRASVSARGLTFGNKHDLIRASFRVIRMIFFVHSGTPCRS